MEPREPTTTRTDIDRERSRFDMKLVQARQAAQRWSAPLLGPAMRLWQRFYRFLEDRAERHVAAWLASLQYKRRYTNPDLVKRYRQRP
jgi:hypothetical protein